MFKRFLLLLLLVLVCGGAILFGRAMLLRPGAVSSPAASPVALDNQGAIERFAGAIRIPTDSIAGQPPNQEAMKAMRDYLETSFPRVHSQLVREVLPDGALLFTWKGKNPDARPVILMGHFDTVPAAQETLDQWKHAPYSGDIAEGFLWGRGTIDDKIHVLSLLEAAETLLGQGFTPARTILLAFGDDEENGGNFGAQNIVRLLQLRNVKPEYVVDEGGLIMTSAVPGLTRPIAAIGTAEKGYLDAKLSTKGSGGHSSEPPMHTAIGQLAAGLTKVENNQLPVSLPQVVRDQYRMLAPYMPLSKRVVLSNIWLFEPLIVKSGIANPAQAGNFRTTTAETMFNAGFKENALPTSAQATINFRILPGDSVDSVLAHVRKVVDDPGITVENASPGSSRNPSSISPIDNPGYRTLETTIHQLFPDAVVVPNLLSAATDSAFYTVLTPNVYRFLALQLDPSALTMAHGINERVAPEKYLKTVQFTAQFLQNIR